MLKLEHANISCTNMDATTRFLVAAFPDFRIRGQGDDLQGRPWRHVGTHDFYLALQAVPDGLTRTPYGNQAGLNHLGWEVEDVAALEVRMRAAGFEPNLHIHDHPARKRSYFYDPDGNDWEFVEYTTNDPDLRHDYSDAT